MHRKMPEERTGCITKIKVEQLKVYVTSNCYPGTEELGEIFLTAAKEGSAVSGLLDSFSIVFSMALQHGVPLEDILDKLEGQRFEPSDHKHSSIMDALAKHLREKYLKPEEAPHASTLRNVKGA